MKDAETLDVEWLDTKYIGRKIHRHQATIRRWIRAEGLKATRLRSGPFMVHRDELKRFMAERSR